MTTAKPPALSVAITLLALSTLTIMVGAAIAPALPLIAENTGLAGHAGWLVTLPSLGVVVFGPLAGRSIQRLGAKRAILIALTGYSVLGVAGALISNTMLLLLDRFLLGGVTVLVMAGGTALIAQLYSGDQRIRMVAYQGMAIELGGVVFLSLGGVLATLGWQAPFSLYLIAGFLAVCVLVTLNETRQDMEEQLALPRGELTGLGEIYGAATFSMIIFFAAFITLPGTLSSVGFTAPQTGYYLAGVSLMAVIFAGLMPRFHRRFGAHQTLLIAFSAYAIAHICFVMSFKPASLTLAAFMLGVGFGLSIPLANVEVIERSSIAERARNLGYLSSAIFLGQFLSTFLGVISSKRTEPFLLAAGLAILAGGGLLLRGRPHKLGSARAICHIEHCKHAG